MSIKIEKLDVHLYQGDRTIPAARVGPAMLQTGSEQLHVPTGGDQEQLYV